MGNRVKMLWSLGLVISLVDRSFWLGFCIIPGFEDVSVSCSYELLSRILVFVWILFVILASPASPYLFSALLSVIMARLVSSVTYCLRPASLSRLNFIVFLHSFYLLPLCCVSLFVTLPFVIPPYLINSISVPVLLWRLVSCGILLELYFLCFPHFVAQIADSSFFFLITNMFYVNAVFLNTKANLKKHKNKCLFSCYSLCAHAFYFVFLFLFFFKSN